MIDTSVQDNADIKLASLPAAQVGRLVEEGLVELQTVATRPVDSFSDRLVAAAAERAFDAVYTSQTTYLLQVRTCS